MFFPARNHIQHQNALHVLGNHDADGGYSYQHTLDAWGMQDRYYYRDIGGLRVIVLDGDGSVLMSLGTLPLVATEAPPNLLHIVLDNEAYQSTGGQPCISANVSIADIAVTTQFVNMELAGGKVDPARWPDLAALVSRMYARESFAHSIVEVGKFFPPHGIEF